jgi:hypothetical protein
MCISARRELASVSEQIFPSGAKGTNVSEGTEGYERERARNAALAKFWARDEALTKFPAEALLAKP